MSEFNLFDAEVSARIVLTLLHFLWQGLLIALVVGAVNLLARRSAASLRYILSFLAMALMLCCLPVTFWYLSPTALGDGVAQPAISSTDESMSLPVPLLESGSVEMVVPAELVGNAPEVVESESPILLSETATPYVVSTYLVGVVLMFGRLLFAFYGGERLRRRSKPLTDQKILKALTRQATRMRLRIAPAVAVCHRISCPIIVGVLKPTILLPVAILTELTPAQIEAVLAHELAHLRRWDHVANLFQRLVETLLFFHPAVWYVSKIVSSERENCCDDLVLQLGADASGYAEVLLRVAEMGQLSLVRSPVVTLAADGGKPTQLRKRVLRVMNVESDLCFSVSRFGTLLVVVLLGLASAGIWSSSFASSSLDESSEAADSSEKDTRGDSADDSQSALSVLDSVGFPVHQARQLFSEQSNGDVRVILLGVHPAKEWEDEASTWEGGNRKAQPGVLVRYICERPLGTKLYLGEVDVLQGKKKLQPPEGIPGGGRSTNWNYDWVQQQGVSPLPDLPKSKDRYRSVKEDFKRGIRLPDGSISVHIQCGADDESQEWTFHDVKVGEFTKSWSVQFEEQQNAKKTSQTKANVSVSDLQQSTAALNAGGPSNAVSLTVFVSQDGTYRVDGRVVGKLQLRNRVATLSKSHSIELTVVADPLTKFQRIARFVDLVNAIPLTDGFQLKINFRAGAEAMQATDPASFLAQVNLSDLADSIERERGDGDWVAGEPLLALVTEAFPELKFVRSDMSLSGFDAGATLIENKIATRQEIPYDLRAWKSGTTLFFVAFEDQQLKWFVRVPGEETVVVPKNEPQTEG